MDLGIVKEFREMVGTSEEQSNSAGLVGEAFQVQSARVRASLSVEVM